MKIAGGNKWEGKRPNPVTDKQWEIIDAIETAYQGSVHFNGNNSRDAYAFINKYHEHVEIRGNSVYLDGKFVYKMKYK